MDASGTNIWSNVKESFSKQTTKNETENTAFKIMRKKYLNKVILDLVGEFRALNFKVRLSCVGWFRITYPVLQSILIAVLSHDTIHETVVQKGYTLYLCGVQNMAGTDDRHTSSITSNILPTLHVSYWKNGKTRFVKLEKYGSIPLYMFNWQERTINCTKNEFIV